MSSWRWTLLSVFASLSYCTTNPLILRINIPRSWNNLDSQFMKLASSVSFEGSTMFSNETEQRSTSTAQPLGKVRVVPARSLPASQSHLLPSRWVGDGTPPNYDLVSEELLIIGAMKQFGRLASVASAFQSIQERIPTTEWTLENVEARIKEIHDCFIVPGWFHQIALTHYKEKRVVDVETLEALFERTSEHYQRNHSPIDMSHMATTWVAQCIEPLAREGPPEDPPCIEVCILDNARAVVARAWALTVPEISRYMDEIEISEMTRLELVHARFDLDPVPTRPSRTRRKRSGTAERGESQKKYRPANAQRSIKWHLIVSLLMRPPLSDEDITARINGELMTSGMIERVDVDQVQLMKTDILRPTEIAPWIHEQLFSLSSEVTAEQFIVAHRSQLPDAFTVDAFNIWFKFCIEPLREFERSNRRGWRPCIEQGGWYRLSFKAVSAYLKHEKNRES